MKKNIEYDLIIVILVIFLSVLVFAIKNDTLSNLDKNYNTDLEVIAKREYSNYAWTRVCHGYAFFNDGSIYYYSLEDDDFNKYNLNTKQGYTDYVLKKGNQINKSMRPSDLNTLLNTIDKLDEEDSEFSRKCMGADMGSTIYSVYKDNNEIVLEEYGNCDGISTTANGRIILKTIDNNIPRN